MELLESSAGKIGRALVVELESASDNAQDDPPQSA